jgi:hypothetical protein
MKEIQTTLTYSRKVQIDRYEPAEVGGSLTVELEDGETVEQAFDVYYNELVEQVNTELLRQLVKTQHVTDINVDELAERLKIPVEDVREAVMAVKGVSA